MDFCFGFDEMKKILIPISIGIAITLIIIGLTGCFESKNEGINDIDKFVGTWSQHASDPWFELSEVNTITFTSERTFSTDLGSSGTYELREKLLILTFNGEGQTLSFNYEFSEENQKLSLIDENKNVGAFIK